MIVVTLRTDKPEAEISIFDGETELASHIWVAHRALAETLHSVLLEQLKKVGKKWEDVGGVVCFKGPGSFTGLRIGLTVANAVAYSNAIPVVAEGGEEWQKVGLERLLRGETDTLALPDYGGEVFVTTPKK